MFGVAVLMSALLVRSCAHIYERCELARELTSLGVNKDHLATWVCIAYHESRFDTSARNHGSGDHGLFQISELYWCGPGKACGVPCTAFRNEDISDDFECVQQIYKEHTRLQGDGFLAWVVYPHHCKHNVKKYLVDCDASLKNVTVKVNARARSFKSHGYSFISGITKTSESNTNNVKPSYLNINSLFEGPSLKEDKDDTKNDWINFKIDNIDELKLPEPSNDNKINAGISTTKNSDYGISYVDENIKSDDWANLKIDNIDDLKLPLSTYKESHTNKNIDWLNIKIDKSISSDSIKPPEQNNNELNIFFNTEARKNTYDEEEKLYFSTPKNNWINFKIDNIDDLILPTRNEKNSVDLHKNINWLNINLNKVLNSNNFNPPTKDIEISGLLTPTTVNVNNRFGEEYSQNDEINDWTHIKIDNIDDLELPNQNKNNKNRIGAHRQINWLNIEVDKNIKIPPRTKKVDMHIATPKTTTIRTTTMDPFLIGIKPPMPRRLETDQFRRKPMLTQIIFSNKDKSDVSTETPQWDFKRNVSSDSMTSEILSTKTLTATIKPTTSVLLNTSINNYHTTWKPPMASANIFNFYNNTSRPSLVNNLTTPKLRTSYNVSTFEIKKPIPILTTAPLSYINKSTLGFKISIPTTTAKSTIKAYHNITSTPNNTRSTFSWNKSPSTNKPFSSFSIQNTSAKFSWNYGSRTTETVPVNPSVTQPTPLFISSPSHNNNVSMYQSNKLDLNKNVLTTENPNRSYNRYWSSYFNEKTTKIPLKQINETNLTIPSTIPRLIKPAQWSFNNYPNTSLSPTTNTPNSTTKSHWSYKPITSKPTVNPFNISKNKTLENQNIKIKQQVHSSTLNPFSTTKSLEITKSYVIQNTSSKGDVTEVTTHKSTTSIFDLYLQPAKQPTLRLFRFPTSNFSSKKLTIFAGGTTQSPTISKQH